MQPDANTLPSPGAFPAGAAPSHPDDHPRSLRDAAARSRRRAMLAAPHMRPLARYADTLRATPGVGVPDFDPLDGGTEAGILFLFEKPGPMTAGDRDGARAGSGFISRNNDDATAEATWRFMREAGIPRRDTVTWNVIPWWNGTIAVTPDELRGGVASLRDLLALLPRLRVVVLVGRKAARAAPLLQGVGCAVFASAHPSPRVRAAFPDRWRAIPAEWRRAYVAAFGEE